MIEDLIENLKNQISELEQTAQDLYNYWFVQFDFPDENGKPYRSSGGKMVWNEELKQEIPKGWFAVRIGDFFKVTMGQSPNGSYINETGDGIPFYQGATHFQKLFPSICSYATSYSREAKASDLLLSVRAPVGRWNIAFTDCAIGRGLSAITPDKGGLFFLVGVIKTLGNVLDRMNSNGTTYVAINAPALKSLQFTCPPDEVLICFKQMTERAAEQIFTCVSTLRELLELKNTLMPLLLNGQAYIGESRS